MKTKFNKSTGRNEWVLTAWYEKVAYVIGFAYSVMMVAAFCIGFISGVLS
jgi:hypothetical protein